LGGGGEAMNSIKGEVVTHEEREATEYSIVKRDSTFDELIELFGDGHLVSVLIMELRNKRKHIHTIEAQLATAQEAITQLSNALSVRDHQLAATKDRLREAEELQRHVIDADKTVDDLLAAGDMLSTLAHEAKAYFAKHKD
jgi:hypothetical protein